ncbi:MULTISPECIES: ribosome small subunit-dependent GTPase A [Kocuria]|uniref:Small ribosomal subunit biogenesis GTPase RsgA n=1 Tax=Kocuria subflava TaxID=1736139 RepID=A0A846TWL3_9MICC|nr:MULTISPECIES: ribosome small subunit-dependent GTPase A [Kocuria]NKE10064.1 ribosome small subunit-dependent GTPase A [Kocuria subflava]
MSRRTSVDYDWDESDVRVRANKKGSRPRTRQRPDYDDAVTGRVVTVDRGRYTAVVAEDTQDERLVTAVRAKSLRRTPIVAGDMVGLVGDTSGAPDTLARLVMLQERSTLLRRSADDTDPVERVVVANADQLVIVVAAADPTPRTGFIDRSLAAAYDAGIEPLLCITKTDLSDPTWLIEHYRELDLTVLTSAGQVQAAGGVHTAQDSPTPESAQTDDSLPLEPGMVETLREHLDGKVSTMLGHSGVGKSTLVNALTGADRATGGVNAVTGRGRHTSSSALALRVPDTGPGTWIIDTPGVRSFGLAHVDPDRIVESFDDLGEAIAQCPKGCTHGADAPGCALDAWVEQGKAGAAGAARLESLRRLLGSGRDDELSEKLLGS